jgi:hypothetical protein
MDELLKTLDELLAIPIKMLLKACNREPTGDVQKKYNDLTMEYRQKAAPD